MKLSRVALSTLIAVVLSSCDDDEAGIREGAPSGMLADSAVLGAMRDTMTVNRIIYDAAPDLSLASAQKRRPDIFRPLTATPTRAAAPKDMTTADDATRRPRP